MVARILHRVGPGDRFKVIIKDAYLVDWADSFFTQDLGATLSGRVKDGQLLVQNKDTFETKLYSRQTKPVVMEI